MNIKITEEIIFLIEYAVPEKERKAALDFVHQNVNSSIQLILLKEFYSSLPEAREEALTKIVVLEMHQGTFLLGASTGKHHYIYCADHTNAVLVGDFEKGVEELDVLLFFGYRSNDEFKNSLKTFTQYPDFDKGNQADGVEFCPVCSVREGEYHQFGCPVEICPWCEGQLNHCYCRFEKLGLNEITTEAELDEFEQILAQKGRIRFEKGQGPSYPVAGDDVLE